MNYEPKTLSEIMNNQQSYYETMYILRPDIAEDEVTNHINKYNKLLEEFGGTILDSQMRGKRRLAYQISKHREGVYVQLSHQGDGQHISKIEKAMRLGEDVIRYMTVKQEGPLPTPKPSNKSSIQAEDGIRDRSPSRGLGDVYKRQLLCRTLSNTTKIRIIIHITVSYTHLTLPTTPYV